MKEKKNVDQEPIEETVELAVEQETVETDLNEQNQEQAADPELFPAIEGEKEDDVEHIEDVPSREVVLPTPEEAENAPVPATPARRRASSSGGKRVVEGDADISVSVLTPEQDQQKRWGDVKMAKERETILERPIVGVEPAGNGRNTPRVFVYFNDFRVAISTREFFDSNLFNDDLSKVSDGERNNREFQMASKMMGAYIPFIILDAKSLHDEATGEWIYAIRASRKEALRRKRERYYFGDKPRIDVDSRVKARVMMPTSRGVLVEVVGQEVFIRSSELSSCKWVDPLYDFHAGTLMYVDVTHLDIDKENKKIDLAVSRKPLDAKNAVNCYNACHEGMRYIGTVVSVGTDYVRINLDCHVRAAAPIVGLNGARLRYGDRVSVAITHKRDDRMTVYGTCIPMATKPF